ncbi:MAG: pantoate--beta-alanine ligase [Planctomycetota bacterium]|nr:pantoate--beta-alanine ligase [Planctomycetota bacterium]
MKILRHPSEVFPPIAFARREGASVGLVPTMGALHAGHYALVRQSASQCDKTIATIFVNPTQFAAGEDLSRYPRTLEADLEGLAAAGADFVFVPQDSDLYPKGFSTFVDPPSVSMPLEGAFRPGHYRGVATIVLKLFNLIPATSAFFGRKDYQQLLTIQKMVDDLNVPIRIEACETVREADGLAMSSRNRYLSPEDRQRAVGIYRSLQRTLRDFNSGVRNASELEATLLKSLHDLNIDQVDYAKVVDAETLENRTKLEAPAIALVAARIGKTRLIDNWLLGTSRA